MTHVMEEVHLTTIKPKNNVLLLAQEISFAKVLACNDKRLRDRGVKRLKKWFTARSQGSMQFTKDDHMRIWKGLFYCMWMSDKPLVQEELAEEISRLVHSFASFEASLLFVEAFYSSLSVEWFGIDQLRLDKFMMLVRRFLRQSLQLVARGSWNETQVQQLADMYEKTLHTAPMGLAMHIIEVFCEELAKVGKGELSSDTILQFVSLFARFLASLKDGRMISQVTRCVFLHLIRQSELGVEHQMKEAQWKEYGFPGGDLDAAERIEEDSDPEMEDDDGSEEEMEVDDEEEEENERIVGVDARAGKVDVLLPPLDLNATDLLKVLIELRNKKETLTKARKTLMQLISKYENLAGGQYPLGLHKVNLPSKRNQKKDIEKAAKKWFLEEQHIIYNEKNDNLEGNNSVIPDKKVVAKRKKLLKKLKKPLWEVSDTKENEEKNESGSNTSWEISTTPESPRRYSNKKRKCNNEEEPTVKSPKTKLKKTKSSPLLLNDCNETSFSPSVVNTPVDKSRSILGKAQTRNQNVQNTPSKLGSSSKSKTKLRKQNPVQTSDDIKAPNVIGDDSLSKINTSTPEEKSIVAETDLQLNISTSKQNNGWGGEWDEPLKEGEYEIFIPNKKYVEKRKSQGLSYPVSSFIEKTPDKRTSHRKLKNASNPSTPGSLKKVEFDLSANCSQDYKEYMKSSKKQVLFDGTKKPIQGLLKNSTPSPINPFYMKKLKLFKS